MVYKILGIERRWRDCCDVMKENLPKPRQMFVTQSRMLATKVEEFYGKLAVSQPSDAVRTLAGRRFSSVSSVVAARDAILRGRAAPRR